MFRPTVFLGSAAESIEIVDAIQNALDHYADVIPWHHSFAPSSNTLDALTEKLDVCDFGVFAVDPLDISIVRANEKSIARDNVIFELGLFIGRFGKDRSFMVKPRGANISLPSDLNGINPVDRQSTAPNGWRAAVNGACADIRAAMQKQGYHPQRLAPLTALVDAYLNAEAIENENARVAHMNALFDKMKEAFQNAPRHRPISKDPFVHTDEHKYLIAYAAAVSENPEIEDVDRLLLIKPGHIQYGNAQHKFVDAIEAIFGLHGIESKKLREIVDWAEKMPKPETHLQPKIARLKSKLAGV
jgi:hypothetical protein